ncbi:hypothetical protein KI387_043220, partial [Taxus chinensis]
AMLNQGLKKYDAMPVESVSVPFFKKLQESTKNQVEIMDVDIDEYFSTLEAFEMDIEEQVVKSVGGSQLSEGVGETTHVPTTENKVQVSEVSSADQATPELNKPEVSSGKSVDTEVLTEKDPSHEAKVTKDSELPQTEKSVDEKMTEVTQDTIAKDKVVDSVSVQDLSKDKGQVMETQPTMLQQDMLEKQKDVNLPVQQPPKE